MFSNYKFYIKKLQKKLVRNLGKRFAIKSYSNQDNLDFKPILAGLNQESKKIVYFHHDLGGGSDLYIQNKIAEFKNSSHIFVIIYKQKIAKFDLQITFKNQFGSAFFNSLEEIFDLLQKAKIDIFYISQILLFPDQDIIFDLIEKSKHNDTKVVMLAHDYYSICTKVFLTKDDGAKCGILENKTHCSCNPQAAEHIKKWQNILENLVDEIIFFSESSRKIITEFFPNIYQKTKIIPHQVPYLRKVKINKFSKKTINIATIGFLHKAKGCDIVEEMAEIISKNNLPVKIVVIGRFGKKIKNKTLTILGKYERNDLPEILENNQIDIVLIPSIWPETFNYTVHEAMMMGVKTACFDLGAQAEYVGKYSGGLIISQIDAKIALDEILNFVKNDR